MDDDTATRPTARALSPMTGQARRLSRQAGLRQKWYLNTAQASRLSQCLTHTHFSSSFIYIFQQLDVDRARSEIRRVGSGIGYS
jgi:hypothetical protein